MLRSLPRPSRPANLALAAIAALVLAASAQAAPIATFDVSMTGVVSGPTTGTSSGSGGIAVLDDTGVLSWTITTQAVTSLTNSLQDLDVP